MLNTKVNDEIFIVTHANMASCRTEIANRSQERVSPNMATAIAPAMGHDKKTRMVNKIVKTGLFVSRSRL